MGMGMAEQRRGRRTFFISYARPDEAWAVWLAWTLKQHWTVELDVWDWRPGENFLARMDQALQRADHVLAVFSPAYLKGPFAQMEMYSGIFRAAISDRRLIPVLIENCTLPPLVQVLVRVELIGLDERAAADRLVAALRGDRPTAPPVFPRGDQTPVGVSPDKPGYPGSRRSGGGRVAMWAAVRGVWKRLTRGSGVRSALVAAGGGGLVVVGVVVLGLVVWPRTPSVAAAVGCPEPREVRVLTSADGLEPMREVAGAYERTTRDGQHCAAVHLYVYAGSATGAGPKATTAALAGGWDGDGRTDPLRDIGPRPDVWLPESTADVTAVVQAAGSYGRRSPVLDATPLGASPVVLGVFAGAGKVAIPTGPISWSALLVLAEKQDWDLVRPDPENSTTGAVATLATYASEAGGNLRHLADGEVVGRVRRAEQRIRAGLDGGGDPADVTSTGLLCVQRLAPGHHAAIITSEQALTRYAAGLPLSAGCGGAAVRPRVVRPTDTVYLDHPLVRFTWTNATAAAGAGAFRGWLMTDAGRAALSAQGLGPPLPPDRAPPVAPDDLKIVLRQHKQVQAPARVLLVVDTSGSMNDDVAGTTSTRFQVVTAGVREALDEMGKRDEFGLWVFPGNTSTGHQQLTAIGRGDLGRRQAAAAALVRLRPVGNTPLYRSIDDAASVVGSRGGLIPAVVVLTDGEDTVSNLTAKAVGTAIKGRPARVYILAVGEARCGGGPLADIAGQRCFEADFTNVRQTLAQLLGTLWGGH
jgi:Mg-chelatase subunit ChlD